MRAPRAGESFQVTEQDYKFGTGPLLVRVHRVIGEVTFDNEPWFEVEAATRHPDSKGSGHIRHVYLRARALPHDPPATAAGTPGPA